MRILIYGVSPEKYEHQVVDERDIGLKEDIEAIFGMYFWKTLHRQTVIYGDAESWGVFVNELAETYGWTVVYVPKEPDEEVESQNQRLLDEKPDIILYFIPVTHKGVDEHLRWAPDVKHMVQLANEAGVPTFSGRVVANSFNYEEDWEIESRKDG